MTTKRSQACGLKSWVFAYASLPGNGISLDLKKSKGLMGSTVLNKCQTVRPCLLPGQRQRNANASAIETAVANKQLFSKAVLGHKPQLTGQLCPTRLTEVRDFRGLWNDNKEKSGMWSEVMGLCVCKSAWK